MKFLLLALLTALLHLPASAVPGDPVQVIGGIGYGHDDNIFRLRDEQPGYDNKRGDSWTMTEGGLSYTKMFGRQKISLLAKVARLEYDYFDVIDHDAKDFLSSWNWQVGNHVSGKIGTAYQQILGPYTDFHLRERNLRRSRSVLADAAWRFHSAGNVSMDFRRDEHLYEPPSLHYNDRNENSIGMNWQYLARSGSKAELVARYIDGQFLNVIQREGVNFYDTFKQNDVRVRALWLYSGTTSFDGELGYAKRVQSNISARTHGGVVARFDINYEPRGKMTYKASIYTDLVSVEREYNNFRLNEGFSLETRWQHSEKIYVNADVFYERRAFDVMDGQQRTHLQRDAIRTINLVASWSPYRQLLLSARLVNTERDKRNVVPAYYPFQFKSNKLLLTARLQF